MAVVARMFVGGFEKKPDGSAEVRLHAVMSKENARWSKYTPSAQFTMSLTREASGAQKQIEAAVDAARAGGKGSAECMVTLEFDNLPPIEVPAQHKNADGHFDGYESDETE